MLMQASLASAGALLLATSAAFAEYTPPRFFELVGGADLVVVGEVAALGQATYTLRIKQVVAGSHAASTVEIVRFHDWACAQRWEPYALGQRLVAFVQVDEWQSRELGRPVYRGIGPGSESELPIDGDDVYSPLPMTVGGHREESGKYTLLHRAKLADLLSAVAGYRTLYQITFRRPTDPIDPARERWRYTARIRRLEPAVPSPSAPFRARRPATTPLSRLKDYAHQSPVHWFLAESTEEFAAQLGAGDIGWKLHDPNRGRGEVQMLR